MASYKSIKVVKGDILEDFKCPSFILLIIFFIPHKDNCKTAINRKNDDRGSNVDFFSLFEKYLYVFTTFKCVFLSKNL